MHLVTNLAEIRGKRTINEIAEASGVNPALVRQIEQGKLVPRDHHVAPLEQALGVPVEDWYPRRVLLVLQEGDEAA